MVDTVESPVLGSNKAEADTELGRRGDAAVSRHNTNSVEYLDWDDVYENHKAMLKRLECAAKG
jgi:hypothetical protein